MSLRIEIRDARLGVRRRLSVAAGTSSTAERDKRRASLLQLLDSERGRAIIERLRGRDLTIAQVHRAVQSLDLDSLDGGKIRHGQGVELGATIDLWLKTLHGLNRSPQTLAFYGSISRSMEKSFGVERAKRGKILKDRMVGDITLAEAEAWLTGARKTTGIPWSPRTQTVAHSLAAQVWDRAIAEDEERAEKSGAPKTIARNFWRKEGNRRRIKAARISRTRVEFLRRQEAGRLLRKIRGTEKAAWIAVGLYAGLRGGEAANLRVGVDVDLKAGTLKIQNREGEHAWRTKTDNSQRTVPLHPRLARWIRAHIKQEFAGEVYLFRLAGKDEPISRSAWRWWTKDAFEAGGIRYGRKKDALVFHSLRHSFASWLTMKDVHPLKISKLMGDTVEMVIRTYSHLLDENLEEAIRRL